MFSGASKYISVIAFLVPVISFNDISHLSQGTIKPLACACYVRGWSGWRPCGLFSDMDVASEFMSISISLNEQSFVIPNSNMDYDVLDYLSLIVGRAWKIIV